MHNSGQVQGWREPPLPPKPREDSLALAHLLPSLALTGPAKLLLPPESQPLPQRGRRVLGVERTGRTMSRHGQGSKLTTARIVKGEGVAGAAMGDRWFPLPERGGGMEGDACHPKFQHYHHLCRTGWILLYV